VYLRKINEIFKTVEFCLIGSSFRLSYAESHFCKVLMNRFRVLSGNPVRDAIIVFHQVASRQGLIWADTYFVELQTEAQCVLQFLSKNIHDWVLKRVVNFTPESTETLFASDFFSLLGSVILHMYILAAVSTATANWHQHRYFPTLSPGHISLCTYIHPSICLPSPPILIYPT
jgi:hypothetical protein